MNKKKLWIAIAAAVLAVVIGAGALIIPRASSGPVAVYPVGMLSYTSSGSGSGESYGVVTADKVQTIYVSDTQTVTRLYVYQGQKVKKGDLLYTYDTTLSDLTLEKKDLAIQQMEINLKTAKEELTKLKAMKPMVVTTSTPSTTTNTEYDKSPASKDYLDTIYGGSGTASDPYRFWISQDTPLYEDLIWDIIGNSSQVYVIFQLTKNDRTNTAFTEEYGVRFEAVELPEETEPTDPSESTAPSDPAESTEPTESTAPSEETEPTETTAPDAGQESAPSGDAQPDGGTQEPEAQSDGQQEPTGEHQTEVAAYQKNRVYAMTFFDPEEDVEEPSTQINWNSGYTQAELTTMKEEKSAEITELTFNIKMGKAELEIMKKEASDGNVYADFDGVVVSVLEPDNARTLNQPMMKITGGGGYYVEGAVSELELDTIQVGMSVSVNCWETGNIYTGTVTQIGSYPSEDASGYGSAASSVTYYPYKVFIDENADLQEGAFVSLTYDLSGGEEEVLYLENAFIRTEGKDSFVYVRNAEGLLEKRYIQVGTCVDGYATPVYSGLTLEDCIAFPYGSDIREGAETAESGLDTLYGS